MQLRRLGHWMIGTTTTILLIAALYRSVTAERDYLLMTVVEQENDPSLVINPPKKRPVPKRPAADPLQWMVFTPGKEDATVKVDPQSREFFAGEKFQIRIKTGRGGYLYVIHHNIDRSSKPASSSRLIFNYAVKTQEVIVPLDCEFRDKYGKCWWETEPLDGKKIVTLILSREPLSGLSNQIPTAGSRLDRNVVADINRKLETEDKSKLPVSKRMYLSETIELTYKKERGPRS